MSDAAPVLLDTPTPTTSTNTDTTVSTTDTVTVTPVPAPAPILAADAVPAAPAPEPAPAPIPAFPENWRELVAEGDAKKLAQLQRYSDYRAWANKAFSLEAKLSSGEYRRPLPKDATPEQTAEWRKEQGLPDKPEDYKAELPEGVVLGELDKSTLEGFQKFAFENNIPPVELNKTLGWYFAEQDRVNQLREIADVSYHEESEAALIADWGLKDYRQNLAAMTSIRDQMPEGLGDRILTGRTSDGRLVGDDPQFLRWFASLSRELNPHATVVNFDGNKTVDNELDAIRKIRREDPNKYDQDKAMQAREGELIDAQLKMKARRG